MRRLVGVAVVIAVVAVGGRGSVAAVKAWHMVAMPNRGGSDGSEVFAVSSSGATNVWAVGRSDAPGGQGVIWRAQPASGSWSAVAGPNLASGEALTDVATWGRNTWAYGTSQHVYEWNGGSWITLPLPPSGFHGAAIVANGANSVWLVGDREINGGTIPAAEHWNGSTWTIWFAHRYPGHGLNTFQAVAAIPGTNKLIAAGVSNAHACEGGIPIAELWTGTTWERMDIFQPPYSYKVYECNYEPGPTLNNEWLSYTVTTSTGTKPFFLHRANLAWIGTPLPAPEGSTYWDISGIDGATTTNVWAVGSYFVGPQGTGQTKPLVEHWNGTAWTVIPAPPDSAESFLNGVSYIPGTCQVDAVGGFKHSQTGNPLPFGERYC